MVQILDQTTGTSAVGLSPDALKIFISYSRRDLAAADAMVAALEGHGFSVTIDRRDLPYGEEWQKELAGFIAASDTVVWLVSPDSVKSKWVNWELGEVGRLSKRLIPVKVRETPPEDLPEALGRIHLLPAEGAYDPSRHETDLVKALNTDRAWLKRATSLGDDAREWMANGRDRARLIRGAALSEAEAWSVRKPADAPAPSSEILELILASRAAQRRGQRITVAGSLAAAVVAMGLAATAFVFQRQAEEATVEATRGAARLAVNVAGSLLDQGQVDEPAVLLLEAAKAFDDTTANDEMLIAFHRVNQAYAQTRSYGLPAGAKAVEGPDALYFIDEANRDVLRFDGNAPPGVFVDGTAEDSAIRTVGFAWTPAGYDAVLVREDNSVERVTAAGQRRPAGSLPPREAKEGRRYDVWGSEQVVVHAAGIVVASSAFEDPDGTTNTYARLIDINTGASMARTFDLAAGYYIDVDGREYLYGGGTVYFDDKNWFAMSRGTSGIEITPVAMTEDRYKSLALLTCIVDGFIDPRRFLPAMTREFQTGSEQRYCRALGDAILVSDYQSSSAGMVRSDRVIQPDGAVSSVRDLLTQLGQRAGENNFSWVGTGPGETLGVIQDRNLTVFKTYQIDMELAHPDAPGPARLLDEERIAVHEPWLNRVVVRSLVDQPRKSIDDPRQEAVAGQKERLKPLNPGSCAGYAFFQPFLDTLLTLPDGTALNYSDLGDEDESRSLVLRGTDGKDSVLEIGTAFHCIQFTSDGQVMIAHLADDTRGIVMFDVGRLRAGGSLEDARMKAPEGFFSSAFPIGDGSALITTDASHSVLRWEKGAEGNWTSRVIYKGDNVAFHAEPDVDGRRLAIIESLGGGTTKGFLQSVPADKRWIELGGDYKWFGLTFGADGTIASGARGIQRLLRLPSLSTLVEETAGQLPARCRPADGASYRTSPCWPASL